MSSRNWMSDALFQTYFDTRMCSIEILINHLESQDLVSFIGYNQ